MSGYIALMKGLKLRCPSCGEGKVLRSYLIQNKSCHACGEDFTPYRADDGPAWLTILLVGHIVAPLIISLVIMDLFPLWAELSISIGIALILTAFILPRAKGLFIAILWLIRRQKA